MFVHIEYLAGGRAYLHFFTLERFKVHGSLGLLVVDSALFEFRFCNRDTALSKNSLRWDSLALDFEDVLGERNGAERGLSLLVLHLKTRQKKKPLLVPSEDLCLDVVGLQGLDFLLEDCYYTTEREVGISSRLFPFIQIELLKGLEHELSSGVVEVRKVGRVGLVQVEVAFKEPASSLVTVCGEDGRGQSFRVGQEEGANDVGEKDGVPGERNRLGRQGQQNREKELEQHGQERMITMGKFSSKDSLVKGITEEGA